MMAAAPGQQQQHHHQQQHHAAVVKCEQQKNSPSPSEEQQQLNNGSRMEEAGGEEAPASSGGGSGNNSSSSSNSLLKKVKSPNNNNPSNQSREVTMENFQDGGQQQPLGVSGGEQAAGFELNSYAQNSGEHHVNDEYGKMNDALGQGQMQAFGAAYTARGNYMGDQQQHHQQQQHGGSQLPGSSGGGENAQASSNSNSPYNMPYGHSPGMVRTGYHHAPQSIKAMGPPRPPNVVSSSSGGGGGGGGGNSGGLGGAPPATTANNNSTMNMYVGASVGGSSGPVSSPDQRRLISGHSISQQGGPTPTLNQLLQSPNPVHRYNSYGEYAVGQPPPQQQQQQPPPQQQHQGLQKDLVGGPQYASQGWAASSRSMNAAAYAQQMANPAYRNQGGSIDPTQQPLKRPVQSPYMSSGPNYPSHQTPPQGQGQYPPQFSQRYASSQGQGRPPPQLGMAPQNYVQQQISSSHYNQQQGPPQQHIPTYDQRTSQMFLQQQAQQNYQGSRPQPAPPPSNKEGSDISEMPGSVEEMPNEPSQGTPTPPVAHPSVSALRPTPSPSGSSGSRSMSPAIITGSQQNIPMPPRPSSQSESQSRMSQSPMAVQGYTQAMAPPHMGPPMYGNKMPPSMMGGSQQMGPYSPQNQQYQQGNYPRNSSSMGIQGYGNQPQSYPGSQPNSMGQPFGMNRIGNHLPTQGYGGLSMSGSNSVNSSSVESVVPIQDEASQQSTASNTSNTDERAETPRPRKDILHSHPPTPASTLPSPGAASMSSIHDEFESVSSPSWPRTPASPLVNSQMHEYHPPPPPIKRSDNLNKLYDISDEPERRMFLDRLVQFNDERGTAITQCPTISKQPLDLFKLYLVVKDRGGFVEVTKAKHWKDVAGLIGIGASSSAAYTLRKQYVKHLLPYECKFDRGGIDPQPIISQLEATTRKKNSPKVNTTPSPAGSSNSQDSFPASNSQSMDGFPTPPGPYSQYSPGSTNNPDYSGQMLGGPPGNIPPGDPAHAGMMPNHNSESINVQNPFADEMQAHQYPRGSTMTSGMPPPTMQNSYGYGNSGNVQPRPPSMSSMPPPYSGNQPMAGPTPPPGPYPYSDQINRSGPVGSQQEPFVGEQFRRSQMMNHENFNSRTAEPYGSSGSGYANRMPNTPPQYAYGPQYERERYDQPQSGLIPPGQQMRPPSQAAVLPQHSADSPGYPPPHRYSGGQQIAVREPAVYPPRTYPAGTPAGPSQQPNYGTSAETYRSEQPYPCYPASQQGIYSPSSKMMPPQGYTQGPKRHPDFMKPTDQPFPTGTNYSPGQPAQPQSPYPAWRNESPYSSYSGQVPPAPPPANQSSIGPQREDWNNREQSGQWSSIHQRYSSQGPGHFNQSSNMPPHMSQTIPAQNMGPNSNIRHFMMHRPPIGSFKDKQQPPYAMQPSKMQQPVPSMAPNAQYAPKREIIFPSDSVEAVLPVLVKRKRMLARDVTPVEAWRLMMALKSGLLCESTWALDVLSVLLFDDNTVLYFSLQHLPGLMEVLMEQYRRCLAEVFGISEDLEIGFNVSKQKEVEAEESNWYVSDTKASSESVEVDLGVIKNVDLKDKTTIVDCEDYTLKSHHGKTVKIVNKNDLFVSDSDKAWDTFEGFNGSSEHWQLGGGDTTIHIQTHFECDTNYVKCVRILEGKPKDKLLDSMKDCVKSEHVESTNTTVDQVDQNDVLGRTSQSKPALLNKVIKSEPVDEFTASCHNETPSEQAECLVPSGADVKQETDCNLTENVCTPNPSTACVKSDVSVPVNMCPRRPRKRCLEDFEDEAYNRDEPSLWLIADGQSSLLRRCICISNILRSLSFVPGNDSEMSKHPGFLLVMGKLLLLHHNHPLRRQNHRNYDKEEDTDFSDSCSSLHDREWWWDGLHVLRENTLVTLANIAGQLDLSLFPEEISLPILDGLLHWSVCPAAYAQDPLPNLPAHSVLSPQRLTLEALCKLSVQDNNVDLILATPPFSRIERLFGFLSRSLSKHEDSVVREFSIVLLHYFSQAESGAARVIACQSASISLLTAFIEQMEQSALTIANTHGINMLRENPEMMGTSLDMLRRAANTLLALARVPENRPLFLQHQQRLINLVMSQILDQHVAAILADVLYECSQPADFLS